jgi:formate hydrogenlyase subunit 6/NADH:ubiquinone oxidoreductase subunit I
MMKILTDDRLPHYFATLEESREVRLPILLQDGTRTLGRPGDGLPALLGGALPGKPTAAFFPQQETVFTAEAGEYSMLAPPLRSLLVVGFTPRDLACLRFIDRFFAEGWRDDLYFRQRRDAVVAGVSGRCGKDGALIPPAGGDCDLEFIRDDGRWLVVPYSDAGAAIAATLPEDAPDEALDRLRDEAAALTDEREAVIGLASKLIRSDRVPDSFWEEIGDRCIACTGCNLACPTCTCFGVQDWRSSDRTERSRMWDSCQLAGFMREASGHNPLGTEALRTRRRIHHKLAADPVRWGEISCFICGRCDAVCPTGIGIVAVSREMTARFG